MVFTFFFDQIILNNIGCTCMYVHILCLNKNIDRLGGLNPGLSRYIGKVKFDPFIIYCRE